MVPGPLLNYYYVQCSGVLARGEIHWLFPTAQHLIVLGLALELPYEESRQYTRPKSPSESGDRPVFSPVHSQATYSSKQLIKRDREGQAFSMHARTLDGSLSTRGSIHGHC